jgi:hypothetical protein
MRNRFVIGEEAYTTQALGGGRFDVFSRTGARAGGFLVKGGEVTVDDDGVVPSRPVAEVAAQWVAQNLSTPLPIRDKNAPPPAPSPPAPSPEPEPEPEPLPAPVDAIPATPAPSPSNQGTTAPGAMAICRLGLHKAGDAEAMARAKRHMEWLRAQAGVVAAYLTLDAAHARVISVVIYASRDAYAAMRYAKAPADAAPLDPVKLEQLDVVG